MKRHLFQTIFAIALTFCVFGTSTMAATPNTTTVKSGDGIIVSETVEYFSDGSSCVTTVIDETPITPYATTFSKTGSKVYTLRNKDGDILWQFTVHGTFSVNSGVSATCTAASYSINIVDTAWENDSASASRSSNKAIGNATFVRKVLFVTIETKSCTVTLTCDSNGNLS